MRDDDFWGYIQDILCVTIHCIMLLPNCNPSEDTHVGERVLKILVFPCKMIYTVPTLATTTVEQYVYNVWVTTTGFHTLIKYSLFRKSGIPDIAQGQSTLIIVHSS